MPGRRKPLGAIAWLEEKPYIVALSKKERGKRVSLQYAGKPGGWFRPTARRQTPSVVALCLEQSLA